MGAVLTRVRIYITHCSYKKDDSLEGTDRKVTPDHLYTGTRIQAFMRRCNDCDARWAILSDYYGVWFSDELHEWYSKEAGDPNRVTESKFRELVENFDQRLQPFDEIYFYHNPSRFHRLYKALLNETRLKDRVVMISHLWEIV